MKFHVSSMEIHGLFSNFMYAVIVNLPLPAFILRYLKITIYMCLKCKKRFMLKNLQYRFINFQADFFTVYSRSGATQDLAPNLLHTTLLCLLIPLS